MSTPTPPASQQARTVANATAAQATDTQAAGGRWGA
jgi:hypothetical protein